MASSRLELAERVSEPLSARHVRTRARVASGATYMTVFSLAASSADPGGSAAC